MASIPFRVFQLGMLGVAFFIAERTNSDAAAIAAGFLALVAIAGLEALKDQYLKPRQRPRR